MDKLRVFEAFAGVGSQRMALRNLGIDHEVVAIAEIDKYAIKSYEAIHGPVNNVGDISKLSADEIPDHDLFTYSFPCQDISVAGRQDGFSEGSGTRSSLLWECRRVIENKKPKYLLLENVKNLVGKKNKPDFEKWLEWLESQGYRNYWQVLNAKDYGVPQNRERVFVVSILSKNASYQFIKEQTLGIKDDSYGFAIDNEEYEFPKKQELEFRLRDILDSEVEEKYYLSKEIQDRFVYNPSGSNVAGTIEGWVNQDQMKRVYNTEDVSPTLNTMQGGHRQPKILIKNATKKGFLEAVDGDGIDLNYPDSSTRRGRVQPQQAHTLTTSGEYGILEFPCIGASRGRNPENPGDRTVGAPTEQRLEINKKGTSNTLTTVQKDNYVIERGFRIRKLMPSECWSLMGFSTEDYLKAKASGVSDSQLYKQAGNSIVVPVLEGIFRNLFLKEAKKWA